MQVMAKKSFSLRADGLNAAAHREPHGCILRKTLWAKWFSPTFLEYSNLLPFSSPTPGQTLSRLASVRKLCEIFCWSLDIFQRLDMKYFKILTVSTKNVPVHAGNQWHLVLPPCKKPNPKWFILMLLADVVLYF